MATDIFDEIEAPAKGDIFDEVAAAPSEREPSLLQQMAGTAKLSPQQRTEALAAFQASPIPETNLKGETVPGKIGAAAVNVADRLARGIVSPMGAFLAPLGMAGAVPRAAMGLGFGLPLAAGGLKKVYEGAATGELQPVAEGALETLGGGLMTTGGIREAVPSLKRAVTTKGIPDATNLRPEQEHIGTPQGPDVPPQPTEVRAGAGEPDSGGGGAVSGAEEPVQAPVQAQAPGDVTPAREFEKSSGFTFNPAKQVGAIKLEGLTPAERAEMQKGGLGPQWEFTDKRPDSPTKAMTFYVPEGATLDQIKAAHEAKLEADKPAEAAAPETKPPAGETKPPAPAPVHEIGSPADEFGAVYGPHVGKEGYQKLLSSEFDSQELPSSDPTIKHTLQLKNNVLWLKTERASKGPFRETAATYLHVKPDGETVFNGSFAHGNLKGTPLAEAGKNALADFVSKMVSEGKLGEKAAKVSQTALSPASATEAPVPATKAAEGETPAVAPAAAKPISEGPGAASPGDVPPPPPPTEPVSARPPEDRPHGIVTPSSPGITGMVTGLGSKVSTFFKGIAGYSMPKITAADRAVGEAGVRYASSHIYAPRAARLFSAQTLQGTGVDPVRFGAALVEDNLRSVREGFRGEVTRLTAEGKPDEAAAAKAKADAVTSLVGVVKSPFRDEDAYQDFLADPATRRAIDQHKQQWEEVVEPMFKRAQTIDPDVELPSRGQQTGARVNLKAILEGEPSKSAIRTGSSLTATFKRQSPFAKTAKGTGRAYEVDYGELMNNTFTRQMEIANKNAFDKALVESGNAVIDKPGQKLEIKGEPGVPFPLTRRVLVGKGEPVPLAQNLYVRQSIAREYRTASNVDPGGRIPILTPIMNGLNRAALAGLTDATVHLSNQMTALFNRPVSGGLISDSLLSLTGRADVPVTLAKALIKSFQNNEAQLSELAEIGAGREAGHQSLLGPLLLKSDKTSRLLLDDTFKRLAEAGLVENTETARREYVNQIGQYNKRLQGPLVRLLRDTGFGPFATAGRTFNALGVKMATLSPGAKGANGFAEAGLRANILSKWVGFSVLLGTLNYMLTKDKGGGLLGRKGVPIGNLDTGMDNDKGRPLSLPLADIMGLGRAARVTGVKGAVQAKYLGLTDGDALDSAARDVINSATGPALGPAIRGATVAATGSPPAVGVPRTAPVAPPGTSQTKVNVEEALKDANPVVRSILDYTRGGKTLGEAIGQQVPRFGLVAGKPEATAEKYPKIVNRAQLNAYTEALAREVRQQPLKDRRQWIADRLSKDELSPENSNAARLLLQRKGVLRFQ